MFSKMGYIDFVLDVYICWLLHMVEPNLLPMEYFISHTAKGSSRFLFKVPVRNFPKFHLPALTSEHVCTKFGKEKKS